MIKEKLTQRIDALVRAKEDRIGRELTDDERLELRSFAAELVVEVLEDSEVEAITEAPAAEAPMTEESPVDAPAAEETTTPQAETELAVETVIEPVAETEEEGTPLSDEEFAAELENMTDDEVDELLKANFTAEERAAIEAEAERLATEDAPAAPSTGRAFAGMSAEEIFAQARAEALEEARREVQTALAEQERSFALVQDVNDSRAFVAGLVTDGQLTPAQKDHAEALLIAAVSVEGETRSFAAAELGEFGQKSMAGLVRSFMAALPRHPGFEPIEAPLERSAAVRSFATDIRSYVTDTEAASRIDAQVRALKTERNCTYAEALAAVRQDARKEGR